MLVIFADLDGLKQINDRLGHQAGDRALLEFAALLRATFRERDLVARMGGVAQPGGRADVHPEAAPQGRAGGLRPQALASCLSTKGRIPPFLK